MSAALVLVLVVAGAYLAAHVAFEWLARRFLIVPGAEYLLLGILLGPQVSGLIRPGVVEAFAPLMTLALGWIGVVIGAQFYLPGLMRLPGAFYRVAFLEALASLVLVATGMGAILVWLLSVGINDAVFAAVALGAVAVVSSPSGIALVAPGAGRAAPVLRQLEVATAVDAFVAIVAVGLLFSVEHPAPGGALRPPTATEWAVIAVGIGIVGGALFHLFLGDETKPDRLFIALAGATILASGAAAHLDLSPLLTAMLIGVILVNTSRTRDEIRRALTRVERPLYFVLLIFAGAAWQPGEPGWLLPVVLFLGARVAAKLAASWLAAWFGGILPRLGRGWGRGLLGQGALALAIALSYRIWGEGPFANIVFTAAVASVLLTDLLSARLVESVVRPFRRVGRRVGAQPGRDTPGERRR
ncbi:MAG: hypothetical protein HY704_16230 [Gemmatimonadetes bacterium]|nr:hypothetical protein [Gemmatimonadota bacterium]